MPVFQRIQTELCQVIDYSVRGTEAHLSLGTFKCLDAAITEKFSLSACVTLTAMTSEADANPLTPVGQSSLSESHSGTYCV